MKLRIITLLAFVSLILGACAQQPTPSELERFFPLLPNTMYIYEVEGFDEPGLRTIFNTYIRGDRAQRMVHATHFPPSTEVISVSGGEVRLIFGDPHHYTLEDLTEAEPNLDIIILREPLEVGTRWNNGAETSEITSLAAPVSTPFGDFEALQVTTTTAAGFMERYYYVQDIGLVKSVHPGERGTLTVLLSQFSQEATASIPIHLFFPNPYTSSIEAELRYLIVPTNGDLAEHLNAELHAPPQTGALALLPEGVNISSIYVYRGQHLAHVDISQNLAQAPNMGDGIIGNILIGLVNTIGHFYEVAYVALTMGGQPFSWGPIELAPGEALQVDDLSHLLSANVSG